MATNNYAVVVGCVEHPSAKNPHGSYHRERYLFFDDTTPKGREAFHALTNAAVRQNHGQQIAVWRRVDHMPDWVTVIGVLPKSGDWSWWRQEVPR